MGQKRTDRHEIPKTAKGKSLAVFGEIAELTVDGEYKKGKALANSFNDYFVDLMNSVHSVEASRYDKGIPDSLFLFATDEQEVILTFKCSKNSKSVDIHDIQIKSVKYVIESVPSILASHFTLAVFFFR